MMETLNLVPFPGALSFRIALGFGRKAWEMMARGYVTAEMPGIVAESHVAMMDAIWKHNKQFRNLDKLDEITQIQLVRSTSH